MPTAIKDRRLAGYLPTVTGRIPQVALAFIVISFWALGNAADSEEGDREWHNLVDPYESAVDMGGYNMRYIDTREGDPIVMVHGFSDSAYCWHNTMPELLQAGFRVILVDQLGMGKSDIPPEPYVYSIENQSRAIMKLCETLNLDQFHLVGHSMGGAIALYLSYIVPKKIKGTVVINPGCFYPPRRLALTYPGATHLASVFAGKWTFRMALKQVYFQDEKVTDTLVDEYAKVLKKPGYWDMLSALSRQFFSDEFFRMVDNYSTISTPALIIWGIQDTWLPTEYGERLHHLIPGSQLAKVDDGGHNAHQECSAVINSRILNFITKSQA